MESLLGLMPAESVLPVDVKNQEPCALLLHNDPDPEQSME